MTTRVERLAGWACDLAADDIPDDITGLLDAQRTSVLAGVAASKADAAYARVRAAVDDPLYTDAAASIALDYDDYLCFGHTGHSAVLVPEHLTDTGDPDDRLVAQAAANEIGARLGGACIVGPLNGQLWSFVHAAGAAIAAARMLGLGPARTAHALAIALTNAPRPTVPGFMAPDAKLLTASEPIMSGVRAARLAGADVTGPLDVLDHPQGFLDAFAYVPLDSMLTGLRDTETGWATKTVCIKPYPGCAYVDTTLDALTEIGPIDVDAVDRVVVDAGVLTCGMDAMSAPYARADPTPVTVTFSIPWNVAIMLVAGRVTPAEIRATWLHDHRRALEAARDRVELRHDWEATLRSAQAFAPLLPLARLARDAGTTTWLSGLRRVRTEHRGVTLDMAGLRHIIRLLATGDVRFGRTPERAWGPDALGAFAMTFPARVEVRYRNGSRDVVETDVPRGAAGHPSAGPGQIAAEKARAYVEPADGST